MEGNKKAPYVKIVRGDFTEKAKVCFTFLVQCLNLPNMCALLGWTRLSSSMRS